MRKMIIIDANVLCAYWNNGDVHHNKAVHIVDSLLEKEDGVVITDHIFDEVISVTMRKTGKISALKVGETILNSCMFIILNDEVIQKEAWMIFKKTEKMSFTDCATIACMNSVGIDRIATFDKEFKSCKGIQVIDN